MLSALRARFSEPTLPRNAHPRDDNIRLDTSMDEKGKRRHDYYLKQEDGTWERKHGISASGFGTYWMWPFPKRRRAWASANAKNRAAAKTHKCEVGELPDALRTTPEMVEAEWEQTADHGTELHALYDKILNGEMMTDEEEAKVPLGFIRAMATHPEWEPYRSEWSVYSVELDIIGQLDGIMRDKDTGELILLDWKHWKDGTSTDKHGVSWHPLFPGLVDTKVTKAMFQTNVYRLPLVGHYGLDIKRIYVFSFPPEKPAEYEEHKVDVRDLAPAFALLPFKWEDPRHLTLGDPLVEHACPRVTEITAVAGPTQVQGWLTQEPLPPEGTYVWISASWGRCGCGENHKGKAGLARCPKKEFDLPESEYSFKGYPHGVFGKEVYMPQEEAISRILYEQQLLKQPAPALRKWQDLYGKILLCWPSEVNAHAAVLQRYVNTLGAGAVELRPTPVTPLDEFFSLDPVSPSFFLCPECKAPAPPQTDCDWRANCISWSCAECEHKPRVTKKIIRAS